MAYSVIWVNCKSTCKNVGGVAIIGYNIFARVIMTPEDVIEEEV